MSTDTDCIRVVKDSRHYCCIREKIRYLYVLEKSRYVEEINFLDIHYFRLNFFILIPLFRLLLTYNSDSYTIISKNYNLTSRKDICK